MFVVIDGTTYRENDAVAYDNSYGHIRGTIKYGEWMQDGSGGEYSGKPCYGWFVEFQDLTPFDYEDDSKEEILEYYPQFERTQSLLYLLRDECMIGNFEIVEGVD